MDVNQTTPKIPIQIFQMMMGGWAANASRRWPDSASPTRSCFPAQPVHFFTFCIISCHWFFHIYGFACFHGLCRVFKMHIGRCGNVDGIYIRVIDKVINLYRTIWVHYVFLHSPWLYPGFLPLRLPVLNARLY